ncbi:MAG: hypothetical protein AB7S48_09655 [Bacteroidales bacterium]
MKKKSFVLLVVILFPFLVQAQNYSHYYDQINRAELKIMDSDFRGAMRIYSQTFSEYTKHHTRDLYNASLCAILSGDNPKALVWMREQITQGATLEGFKAKTYKQLPETDWAELRQEYDSLHAIYTTRIDGEYNAILDSLRSSEQRLAYNYSFKYEVLIFEHAKILYSLISKKGIPLAACYDGQKLPIDVIRHHFGVKNLIKYDADGKHRGKLYAELDFTKYDLEPLLIDAVFRGDLEPQFVATCLEYNEVDPSRKASQYHISIDLNTKTVRYMRSKGTDTIAINAYRKYIGFESLGDAMRKNVLVSLYYNQDKFPFDEHLDRFREIGYNKVAMDTLTGDARNEVLFKSVDIDLEIKHKHLQDTPLFDFKINQDGFTHSIKIPVH